MLDYVQQGDLALLDGITFDQHGRHVGHSPEVSFAPLAMILGRCPPRRMRERGGSEWVRGGYSGKEGFQSAVMQWRALFTRFLKIDFGPLFGLGPQP